MAQLEYQFPRLSLTISLPHVISCHISLRKENEQVALSYYLTIVWEMTKCSIPVHHANTLMSLLLRTLRKQSRREVFSEHHSFSQQIFTEHLVGARNCSTYQRYSSKQNKVSDLITLKIQWRRLTGRIREFQIVMRRNKQNKTGWIWWGKVVRDGSGKSVLDDIEAETWMTRKKEPAKIREMILLSRKFSKY